MNLMYSWFSYHKTNIPKWISVFYNDVECEIEVINGGHMTIYFRVPRGVREVRALSPLFIHPRRTNPGTKNKIRRNLKVTGIKLPFSCEGKLSHTFICKDTSSLHENMSVLGKFGDSSGLKLNSKKTKALWIGSMKNSKNKPLEMNVSIGPIKIQASHISLDSDKNMKLNFFQKLKGGNKIKHLFILWPRSHGKNPTR